MHRYKTVSKSPYTKRKLDIESRTPEKLTKKEAQSPITIKLNVK